MKDKARSKARQLAHDFIQRGDATGWFEALYASAHGDEHAIQWADMTANPNLVDWLKQHSPDGKGHQALVITAGLQLVQFEDYMDQEELPTRRFRVQYRR